eukprot:m.78236 g.78236  ORF g.78236 m.78236 type:complete len:347 (+) comp12663_c0_seq2:65-1105(+)
MARPAWIQDLFSANDVIFDDDCRHKTEGPCVDLVGDGSIILSYCNPRAQPGAPIASPGAAMKGDVYCTPFSPHAYALGSVKVFRCGEQGVEVASSFEVEGVVGVSLSANLSQELKDDVMCHALELALPMIRSSENCFLEIIGHGSSTPIESTNNYNEIVLQLHATEIIPNSRPWDVDIDIRMAIAKMQKQMGTNLVKTRRWRWAAQRYGKAIQSVILAGSVGDESQFGSVEEHKDILVACYLNLALCHLKMGAEKTGDWKCCYRLAIDAATRALEYDPNSVKGLYRRAMGYRECDNINAAIEDLKRANRVDPMDKAVRRELSVSTEMKNKKLKKLKDGMSRMFGGG